MDSRFHNAVQHTVSQRIQTSLNQRQAIVEQERQKLLQFLDSKTFMAQEDRDFFVSLFNFYQHIESESLPPVLRSGLPLTLDISSHDGSASVVIFSWSLRNSNTDQILPIAQVAVYHAPAPYGAEQVGIALETLEDHLELALDNLCYAKNRYSRLSCTPACRTVEFLKDQLHEFNVVSETPVVEALDYYDCLLAGSRFSVAIRLTPNASNL